MSSEKKHFEYLVFEAGIMISAMVLFHVGQVSLTFNDHQVVAATGAAPHGMFDPNIYFPFLLFFLPWFFYKSGSMFRARDQYQLLKGDVQKLLMPWLKYLLLGYAVYVVLSLIDQSATWKGLTIDMLQRLFLMSIVPINNALWFLFSLSFVRQAGNLLLKHLHPFVVAVLALILPFGCYLLQNPNIPIWVANIGSGLFFYAVGYGLHKYEFADDEATQQWWRKVCIVCGVIFIAWCVISYFLPADSLFRVPVLIVMTNKLSQGVFLLSFVVVILGTISCNLLCRYLWDANIVSWVKQSMHFVGDRSMEYLVLHLFVLYPIFWFFDHYLPTTNPWYLALVGTVAVFSILGVCLKKK